MVSLTPFITPAFLLQSGLGLSWETYPQDTATPEERIAALLDVCWSATSAMELESSQQLRTTLNTEQEFGPDRVITYNGNNGWARMSLSRWPILQIISVSVSNASAAPTFRTVPVTQVQTEHSLLPDLGTIAPSSAGQGPTAILIPPGYVSPYRNGNIVAAAYMNGWPVAGINAACIVGANSIHVDDISGWWNGTAGARGTIYDPPRREEVTVTGVTPDVPGAITGPGSLAITATQFAHTPTIGQSDQPDQTILITTMPRIMIEAGLYFCMHFGLLRGAQAAVMQSARGIITSSNVKEAQDWYDRGKSVLNRIARAQV